MLAVLSNVDAKGAEYARTHFLKEYFDVQVMSCEVGYVKPDPLIYEICIEELGIPQTQTWMVGDNMLCDVSAAKDMGLNAVHIDRLGNSGSPDCISNLVQLREVIG